MMRNHDDIIWPESIATIYKAKEKNTMFMDGTWATQATIFKAAIAGKTEIGVDARYGHE